MNMEAPWVRQCITWYVSCSECGYILLQLVMNNALGDQSEQGHPQTYNHKSVADLSTSATV